MKTILVINSKGGCGKTTVTTNLASYYACNNLKCAIMDYDPQGSSLNWIKSRASSLPRILGANAAPTRGLRMSSADRYIPPSTELLFIDPPAGATGLLLQDLVHRADCILIPVAPSSIDIHASAHFVKELFLTGGVRRLNKRLAVVANKVRCSMPIYDPLERFLKSLSLPLLTRITDSDNYLKAVEDGCGVFEMNGTGVSVQRREFLPVIDWLGIDHDRPDFVDSNVFAIGAARRSF